MAVLMVVLAMGWWCCARMDDPACQDLIISIMNEVPRTDGLPAKVSELAL